VGAAFQPRFRQDPLKKPRNDEQQPQGNIGKNPGEDIVQHYTPTPVQSFFYNADGRRFNDIKQPEEKKTQTESQKVQREPEEGYEETHHLVDHDRSGVAIFKKYFRSACNPGGKGHKDEGSNRLYYRGCPVGNYNDRYGGERSPGSGHGREKAGEASGSQEDHNVILAGRINGWHP